MLMYRDRSIMVGPRFYRNEKQWVFHCLLATQVLFVVKVRGWVDGVCIERFLGVCVWMCWFFTRNSAGISLWRGDQLERIKSFVGGNGSEPTKTNFVEMSRLNLARSTSWFFGECLSVMPSFHPSKIKLFFPSYKYLPTVTEKHHLPLQTTGPGLHSGRCRASDSADELQLGVPRPVCK